MLNDTSITIVSFDIFDTLLLRRTSSHREVFEQCGTSPDIKALFDTSGAFVQYRQAAEQSARQRHNTKEEIVLEEIYDEFSLTTDQKRAFQELELLYEEKALLPNLQTDRWIKMAHDAGKKVILISDMYLTTQQIIRIGLSKLRSNDLISHIFVSSECGYKKATGNLFNHVRDTLGFDFSQQFHIGDNIRSDIQIPHTFGIKTLHYGLDSSSQNAIAHEYLYSKTPLLEGHHARLLSALLNPFSDKKERFYFSLASLFFAPALWEFSHWLAKTVQNRNLIQLNFLMREGDTFQYCFSKLYPNIQTRLIYASRQSTFLPTLNHDALAHLNFHLYKALSIKDFYATYHLPINDPMIQQHQHLLCTDADTVPVNSSTLLNYFMDDINQRVPQILAIAKNQKTLLNEYFTSQNISNDSALIDFGGGGTVIKRLSSLLPESLKPQLEILFYQHAQGYKNLVNHHILSFLPYTQKTAHAIQNIARTYDFIEILLNAEAPTTLSYKKIDHRSEPELYLPDCNANSIEQIIHAFRTGIDTFFSIAETYTLPSETYDREFLSIILSRIIDFPTQDEALNLGELEYDEGKGSRHISTIIDAKHLSQGREIGIERLYQNYLTNPSAQKHRFPWVQGVITQLFPNYLSTYFGKTANPNQDTINALLEKLDHSGIKQIMVYGAGELFKYLLPSLKERNIHIIALIDSRAETAPFSVEGYNVVSLAKALEMVNECTIVIASAAFTHAIVSQINPIASDKTITLITHTLA
jgi:HAD superfamily hydrolase (TIGR01549 family)